MTNGFELNGAAKLLRTSIPSEAASAIPLEPCGAVICYAAFSSLPR
jgi:hypothetical protein